MLRAIKQLWGGSLYEQKNGLATRLHIAGQQRLNRFVVPYFDAYMPRVKKPHYLIWREAFALVLIKGHLTLSGLEKIKGLKAKLSRTKKSLE